MLLLIIIEHVGQDILRVLETLRHLRVVAVQGLVQWHRRSLALLVHIGHVPILGVEQDLCVILEVNLDYLVAKPEHDRVLGSHPFLDVNGAGRVLQFVGLVHFVSLNELLLLLRVVILFQIRLEMLQQSHLLLQFLREVREIILLHHVLLLVLRHCFSLVVVELGAARLRHDLCRVVEEHACRHV